ncbi:hypothetical protein [Acidobacterium sp. S8]|uniref:hypothetical protein n=1 Tax=Acidobacterium sp. S8 TaxID=1641854 RepID=UPI00131E253A|nr:hypothetical protein [Acidobacterium sp. S8]
MKNASNIEAFLNLNEHRPVVDEDGLRRRCLGNVESKPKDIEVRLAHVNQTGRAEFTSRDSSLTTTI